MAGAPRRRVNPVASSDGAIRFPFLSLETQMVPGKFTQGRRGREEAGSELLGRGGFLNTDLEAGNCKVLPDLQLIRWKQQEKSNSW